MVSWGRAFKAALVLMVFMIVWGLLGTIILFSGVFTGVFGQMFNISTEPPFFTVNWTALGIGAILVIIGTLIIVVGTWASIFKVFTELIVEEVKKTFPAATAAAPTPTSGPACPKCGTPLMYVQQYQRWYCPTCKEYQ
ncbi:MAG: hypothetical protein HA496_05130 [Thaumarchaeota archaeon]|jgi:hypothetical protein|nr:hypothetical protein [Nitrososphaerota archaeon]